MSLCLLYLEFSLLLVLLHSTMSNMFTGFSIPGQGPYIIMFYSKLHSQTNTVIALPHFTNYVAKLRVL